MQENKPTEQKPIWHYGYNAHTHKYTVYDNNQQLIAICYNETDATTIVDMGNESDKLTPQSAELVEVLKKNLPLLELIKNILHDDSREGTAIELGWLIDSIQKLTK